MSTFQNTLAYAQAQDAADPLRAFRNEFHFPEHPGSNPEGEPVVYLTGNSLGLQPKAISTPRTHG